MERVLIEIVVSAQLSGAALLADVGARLPELKLDAAYAPVEIRPRAEDAQVVSRGDKVVVVRGQIEPDQRAALEARPEVLKVWTDAHVEPFGSG